MSFHVGVIENLLNPRCLLDKIESAQLIKKVGAHVKALARHREEKGESNPKVQ